MQVICIPPPPSIVLGPEGQSPSFLLSLLLFVKLKANLLEPSAG